MTDGPDIVERVPGHARSLPRPPLPRTDRSHPRRRRQTVLSVVLFVVTFLSACLAWVPPRAGESLLEGLLVPFVEPTRLLAGLPFAVTLLAILLAHEMGHYLTARRYGVDQSPPFFIPAPTLFGTLGAVILMRSQPPNRRVLLNVAVMGPYAGLVLAIPAAAWGLAQSTPIDVATVPAGTFWFGSSLLFHGLEQVFSPNGSNVGLHPVALAGWVGMFVTSLNLIPAAQLDGGHIAYALFGRRQEKISLVVVLLLLGTGMFIFLLGDSSTQGATGGEVWILWALLLFVIGLRHPPVRDESIALTRGQRLNGGLALLVFVLTFIPVPVKVLAGPPQRPTENQQRLQPRPSDGVEEPAHRGPAEEFRL